MEPQEFTEQLYQELKSTPQPCLVPFLKVSSLSSTSSVDWRFWHHSSHGFDMWALLLGPPNCPEHSWTVFSSSVSIRMYVFALQLPGVPGSRVCLTVLIVEKSSCRAFADGRPPVVHPAGVVFLLHPCSPPHQWRRCSCPGQPAGMEMVSVPGLNRPLSWNDHRGLSPQLLHLTDEDLSLHQFMCISSGEAVVIVDLGNWWRTCGSISVILDDLVQRSPALPNGSFGSGPQRNIN